MLIELLQTSDVTVWCLIRRGRDYLKSKLSALQLASEYERYADRIKILQGDFSLENLGLPVSEYSLLRTKTATVFHVGAKVNHVESYNTHRPHNVVGTRNIIQFCAEASAQLVFISTTSVLRSGTCERQTIRYSFLMAFINAIVKLCTQMVMHKVSGLVSN